MSKEQLLGTRIVEGALELAGAGGTERVPLIAGGMPYHDVPRASWGRCLDALVDLGFGIVDSCVPWSIYEPRRDDIAFDGAGRPDLAAFLNACADRGLKVMLQLGPLLDLELPQLGLPGWICADQRYLAVGAHENPLVMPAAARAVALPSWASRAFVERATHWIARLASQLQPFCFPDGPLVAVHLGARAGLAGRLGAYDQDYHPDAITAYRRWLARRYPDGLPPGYDGQPEPREPPRRFAASRLEDLIVQRDWLGFKESVVSTTLGELRQAARDNGLGRQALLHGLDGADLGLSCQPQQLEQQVGALGIELAQPKPDAARARASAMWLQGNSRLPFVWRLAWGNRPWLWVPQTTEQQRDLALTALMFGVRGISFSGAVERNHWCDAAIDRNGGIQRSSHEQLKSLVRALHDLRWLELRRQAPVALMRVREVAQLQRCSSLVDPLPPEWLALLGVRWADADLRAPTGVQAAELAAVQHWTDQVERTLAARGVPHTLVDSGLGIDRLRQYQVLVVPLLGCVDPALLRRLQHYAAGGGRLVIGPFRPQRDLCGEALTPEQSALPAEAVVEQAGQLDGPLGGLLAQVCQTATLVETSVETSLHLASEDTQQDGVLFLRNSSKEPQRATIGDQGRLWDALSGVPLAQRSIELAPGQLRMLRFRRDPDQTVQELPGSCRKEP